MTPPPDPGIAIPRPSATVVVVREAGSTPEVLLVKRRAGDAFGNSYAFPGGVIDQNEADATAYSFGLTDAEANDVLSVETNGLNYYCAGIRELFEETGILLARNENGIWADCNAQIARQRTEVDRCRLQWSDFLQQHELAMAFDSLHYFAHWVTPLVRPKRWTTRFFLTELPPQQTACHDGIETIDSRWMTAANALQQNRSGDLEIPYPTKKTLESLRNHRTVAEMKDWAHSRRVAGIEKIRPDHVVVDDQGSEKTGQQG
ncbi:MAG: NUDIX hydrolase [Woeseiaceae bacterium]